MINKDKSKDKNKNNKRRVESVNNNSKLKTTGIDNEDIEKRKEIVRALLETGREKGILTYKEIMDSLQNLELDTVQIEKIYETLEKSGVEVVANNIAEEDLDQISEEEPEDLNLVAEETAEDLMKDPADGVEVDDPIHMYLREIGKIPLISQAKELELAQRILDGDESAKGSLQKRI